MRAKVNGPNRTSLLDWAFPVVAGAIFAVLFFVANPVVTAWFENISFANAPTPERVIAWGLAGIIIWPLLRIHVLRLGQPVSRRRATVQKVGLLNARSVTRALILFNVIFAAQTLMDVGYLWGGVRLPDGMTYATYAHRGAYPLMATALLAGGFALVAQTWLDGRVMRGLLLVWIVQTLILVMSSILRLALNVDGLPARVTLGVRPEHLLLADGPADLTVTPTMIENTGAECYITFDLAGISLTAKVPGRMDEDTLDRIGLNVATTALSLFDIDTDERINRP